MTELEVVARVAIVATLYGTVLAGGIAVARLVGRRRAVREAKAGSRIQEE